MDLLHPCCAGMDVHKNNVHVCIRKAGQSGQVVEEFRVFGTTTRELLALAEWLVQSGVSDAAMESTGVYWKPVYNLLEGRVNVLLCNARHVKNVPGRKTDTKDCQWLAQLLQYGLLRASLVPPRPVRELRDLTRTRASMEEDKTRVANRIHKVLEDANIKLSGVATDIFGVSGRQMIYALIGGQTDAAQLAKLARGQLKKKESRLALALEGHVTEHHRFMLRLLMDQLREIEGTIEKVDARIEQMMGAERDAKAMGENARPFGAALTLLVEMWGISRRSAENILAETGTDMSRFPSHQNFTSWGKMCPGNNFSAGKNRSSGTGKGNPWLRRALVQAAWAASRAKKSYFASRFKRLSARRGKQRALIAIAHSMLKAIYYMLRDGVEYRDLGPGHFENLNQDKAQRYFVKRLQALGFDVALTRRAAS